jgi:uncharacterized MnhB-related membrane protein
VRLDETVLEAMQIAALLLVAVAGTGVVLTRDPASQTVTVSAYGLLLALLFFLYQAPDVALSQLVIGAVAFPLMVLLSLAKVRRDEHLRRGPSGEAEERG